MFVMAYILAELVMLFMRNDSTRLVAFSAINTGFLIIDYAYCYV